MGISGIPESGFIDRYKRNSGRINVPHYKTAYINQPTAELVSRFQELAEDLTHSQADPFSDSSPPKLQKALSEFEELGKKKPAIIDYIAEHTDPNNPEAGFTKRQMEILIASMIFRSSPTYSAIPAAVATSAAQGKHKEALRINDNAMEETGDSRHEPHSLLLYKSMKIVADALGVQSLNPNEYFLARHLSQLREDPEVKAIYRDNFCRDNFSEINDKNEQYQRFQETYKQFSDEMKEKGHIIHNTPSPKEFAKAIYFADLLPEAISQYHETVLHQLQHDREAPSLSQLVEKIELARREASSVDEPNNPSYIGSYGNFVHNHLGYISPKLHDDAREWVQQHNDDDIGQSKWGGNAESGHANDACRVACDTIMEVGDPDLFAQALNRTNFLTKASLGFWDGVVERMEEVRRQDIERGEPPVPLKPAEVQRSFMDRFSKLHSDPYMDP